MNDAPHREPRHLPDRHAEGWQPGNDQTSYMGLPEWLQREVEQDERRDQRRADLRRLRNRALATAALLACATAILWSLPHG